MEKTILEKIKTTQNTLQGVVDKISTLTSGNVAHVIPSIRSITLNINEVMIDDIIQQCEDNEIKQLLEKIERNVYAIDNFLQQINPSNVDNAKNHLISWMEFYVNAINEALKKYET